MNTLSDWNLFVTDDGGRVMVAPDALMMTPQAKLISCS